jgi:hypothetical protein
MCSIYITATCHYRKGKQFCNTKQGYMWEWEINTSPYVPSNYGVVFSVVRNGSNTITNPPTHNRVTAIAQCWYVPRRSMQLIFYTSVVYRFSIITSTDNLYIDQLKKRSWTVLLELWQSHFVTVPGQTQWLWEQRNGVYYAATCTWHSHFTGGT